MQLTKNFTLQEFVNTSHAEYLEENKEWALKHLPAITNTAQLLQPVRDKFGRVILTSGIRSAGLNSLVGGAPNSQHLLGEAADLQTPEADIVEVFGWICKNLVFGQCILEYHNGKVWIHLSTGVKCEKLIFSGDKYVVQK